MFPKTHDLGDLLDRLARVDPALAASLRDAVTLNPYGVEERYPGESSPMTFEEAKAAIRLAATVREAIGRAIQGLPPGRDANSV